MQHYRKAAWDIRFGVGGEKENEQREHLGIIVRGRGGLPVFAVSGGMIMLKKPWWFFSSHRPDSALYVLYFINVAQQGISHSL